MAESETLQTKRYRKTIQKMTLVKTEMSLIGGGQSNKKNIIRF
jgi:hypothetical protein